MWLLLHLLVGAGLLIAVLFHSGEWRTSMAAWAVLAPGLVVSYWLAVVHAVKVQRLREDSGSRVSAKGVALVSLSWFVVFEVALLLPLWVFVSDLVDRTREATQAARKRE